MKRFTVYIVIATAILLGFMPYNHVNCDELMIIDDDLFTDHFITKHGDSIPDNKISEQMPFGSNLNQKLNQLMTVINNRYAKKPFKWNRRRDAEANLLDLITKNGLDRFLIKKSFVNEGNVMKHRLFKKKQPFKWGR